MMQTARQQNLRGERRVHPTLVIVSTLLALLALVGVAYGAAPASPTPGVIPVQAPATKPPAPAFKPGMDVVDRNGAKIGSIQTVTEGANGLNVVLNVEGMMVGVKASSLRLEGGAVVSAQTKAEVLGAAGAPPR